MRLKNPEYHFKCGTMMKIILCISIVSALVFSLFNLYIAAMYESILRSEKGTIFATSLYFFRENIMEIGRNGNIMFYYLSSVFLCFVLIFGALRMWSGRIWGLLFYSVSKIMLVVLPIFFLGSAGISSGDVMLALFFLTFYSINIYVHKYKIE
jgi:hypothetical protein